MQKSYYTAPEPTTYYINHLGAKRQDSVTSIKKDAIASICFVRKI